MMKPSTLHTAYTGGSGFGLAKACRGIRISKGDLERLKKLLLGQWFETALDDLPRDPSSETLSEAEWNSLDVSMQICAITHEYLSTLVSMSESVRELVDLGEPERM